MLNTKKGAILATNVHLMTKHVIYQEPKGYHYFVLANKITHLDVEMSNRVLIVCPHCGKNDFAGSRGLVQHLKRVEECRRKEAETTSGRRTRARARAEAVADDLARREAAQTSRRVTRSATAAAIGEAMLAEHDADVVGGVISSKENPNSSTELSDDQMDDADDESSQENDQPDRWDESEEEASDDEDDLEDDAALPMDDEKDNKVVEEAFGPTNTRLLDPQIQRVCPRE